jgi:hypothetical protein
MVTLPVPLVVKLEQLASVMVIDAACAGVALNDANALKSATPAATYATFEINVRYMLYSL